MTCTVAEVDLKDHRFRGISTTREYGAVQVQLKDALNGHRNILRCKQWQVEIFDRLNSCIHQKYTGTVGIGKAEIAITVQIEQVEYDGILIFSYHRWCRIPEFN